MRDYGELRQLRPGGIAGRQCPQALQAVTAIVGDDAEASSAVDLQLLHSAQNDIDPLPLLALRCRVSHPLEAWIRATHRQHQQRGIELQAMASYALDDDGALVLRSSREARPAFTYAEIASLPQGLISPFTAEVLRSYDPARCGLPHWARLKIQSHNGLKAYLRQHGLLLISDWALLRNSSRSRVQEAMTRHLRSADAVDDLLQLHGCYGPLYDQAKQTHKTTTGKASGWQPDPEFLRQLAPDSDPFATLERLQAMATAIRQLLSGAVNAQSLDALAEQGLELADTAPSDAADDMSDPVVLRDLIDQALNRSMDRLMPRVLAAEDGQSDLLHCLWAGWAEGLSQRSVASRCGCSQSKVSKKLELEVQATAIATAAAVELKRHAAFAACGKSVEAADRLVAALRNHLLQPEREGDVAPLRRWTKQYLTQS
jgi:hypothetical protein